MSNVNVKFFVEGSADRKFLMDLMVEHFQIVLEKEDIDILDGWGNYKSVIIRFNEQNDYPEKVILILDNDTEERKQEILAGLSGLVGNTELFLLPDDSRIGELETLLSDIAVKRDIIECFDQYKKCISQYNPTDEKDKIFAYLDALLPKKEKKHLIKEENRNYRNKDHWDLHHKSLTPLLAFLSKHIKP